MFAVRRVRFHRDAQWRARVNALLIFAILVLLLPFGTTGCAHPASEEEAIRVAEWTVELSGSTDPPRSIHLPSHFDRLLPKGPAEYVLRTLVKLPPAMQHRPLALTIAHMPGLAVLRVDGVDAVPVEPGLLDLYRATGPQRWHIPESASADGALELELRVSHRFVRSAWIDSPAVLTTHPTGGARIAAVHAFNTVAATGALAAALFVAFFYGVLFVSLRDTRRASYGWFALGALSGMPYPAYLLGLTQPVFGVYEGTFMMLALILGSLAAMAFSRVYVGAPLPSRLWIGVFAAAAAAAVAARNPFISSVVMGPVALAVTIATTVAQVGFLLRLRQAHRQGGPKPPSLIYGIALAWPATVLLGLPDVLAWLGQGDPTGGVQTACLGIMWISFYQSLSLSREHLVSLKRADELNRELEERVRAIQTKHREVELLNDELRRQIAARSRELAEKLAQMDDDVLEAPPLLEEGTVVESRYRIIKELGSGGMGTVYEVERITDGNHFALKALGAGGDSQARARFAREAQIVANVNHPNVVSIVDVDVAQSGFLFLVMELVAAGTTLHDVRRRHRDIPWTMGILAQVAEGLCAIHEAGIIHRDLKPGNILLSRGDDGRKPLVKITDFGISRLAVDGARVSLRERTAVKRTVDELPDARDALDPFGPAAIDAAITAHFARTAADAKTRRALPGNAPAMPHEERDSGLVTSARTDLLLHPASDDAGAFAATTLDVAKTTPTTPATPTADTAIEQASPAIHKVLPDEAKAKAAPAADAAPTANEQPVIQREGVTPAHAGLPRGVTPQSPLTEPGLIFGTPQYMAQELTSGTNQATRASDVFSLGIIAFEVLTGRRPFAEAPVSAKLSGKPLPVAVPFRAVCPTLPAAIAELLDRAMDHDPLARPTSRELAIQLRAIASRGAA